LKVVDLVDLLFYSMKENVVLKNVIDLLRTNPLTYSV